MARPGPAPKPTRLKLLENNPGKRPLNKNEPKPKPIKPSCPRWLSKHAKREWRRLSRELERLGLLTKIDRGVFAQYCQAYATWREAEEVIRAKGFIIMTPKGHVQQIPHVNISHKAQLIMLRCAQEIGLTPSSRSRISVSGQEDEDVMAGLLD